eukprot:TRINITY_DN11790_c0_g1_i1.p1 TRINITY_DN11790_c0_g1~~TRINITY_DN11790_c0_g1_i1.p1  ORF type:complete len:288 (-),score=38.77 TRINITY_DN11790_c0_g1_i1:76-939(-)
MPERALGSRSRSPRRERPFLCIIVGGPCSGKTSLGDGLQRAFPGLCHTSSGDIARLAAADTARTSSPLLNSIGRQLADSRRRKGASRRMSDFVNAVTADVLRSNTTLAGMFVDGLRSIDLIGFEKAHGNPVRCVLCLDCTAETMLARLNGRANRDGDELLGHSDGGAFAAPATSRGHTNNFEEENSRANDRISAYIARASVEEEAIRSHFGAAHEAAVHRINGDLTREECLAMAVAFVQQALHDMTRAKSPATLPDWPTAVAATATRLDLELHPDGRPRQPPPKNDV